MARNNRLQQFFSVRFRRLLSGAPDGVPPWLDVVAAGSGPGLYVPTDAPWVVHRDFATLIGGIRALLMQALHPGALAGVTDHSRYASDPLGRLAGTIRWLTVTTFGSEEAIRNEAKRVNQLHTRVTGTYETTSGATTTYRARDTSLLLWVHVAFMESFLTAHEWYSPVPIPQGDAPTGGDNYVSQWGDSVRYLGLSQVPRSLAELDATFAGFVLRRELTVGEQTRAVIEFIRHPPLPVVARSVYALLFQAAVVSLRPEFRDQLGIRTLPAWIVRPAARGTLGLLRTVVGPESPIEDAALARLGRSR